MNEHRSQDQKAPKEARCPLCGKPRQHRYRPFCSARCRDVDLGRWFTQTYAVPAAEPGSDEDNES